MESFATTVNDFQPLTVVAKLSILDVCRGLGNASALFKNLLKPKPNLTLTKNLNERLIKTKELRTLNNKSRCCNGKIGHYIPL